MKTKRIEILIPKGRKLIEGFATSLMGLLLNAQHNDSYTLGITMKEQPFVTDEFDNSKYQRIAEAREALVEDAISNDVDYILFLDDDTVFPANCLDTMLGHDVDFISGINFAKKVPYMPTQFTSHYTKLEDGTINQKYKHILDYPEDLIEVEGVGLFCALIKTEAIKKLRHPYFSSPELVLESHIGEDISFSRRFWEAGLKIHVDTRIKCGHIFGDIMVTESDFIRNKKLAKELYARI